MFTPLILACTFYTEGLDPTQCAVFYHPQLFPTEDQCMMSLADGIIIVEQQGWYVKDYQCAEWPLST